MATLFQVLQFFDGNGAPLSGGKLNWYESGTVIRKDTYIDEGESAPATNPIILDAEGRVTIGQQGIWIRGSYKLIITDSNDAVIPGGTLDNINEYDSIDFTGLTATIADLNSTTTTARIVTNTATLTLADRNTTILCDATGGALDINLPAATTAGNKYRIYIKKIDAVNFVTIKTPSSELIDGSAEHLLSGFNNSIGLHCDGSNWYKIAGDERPTTFAVSASRNVGLANEHNILLVDTPSGAVNITLPDIATVGLGYRITIKKTTNNTFPVNILTSGGQLIDTAASLAISIFGVAYTLNTEGSAWWIKSSYGLHIDVPLPFSYWGGMYVFPAGADPLHDIEISPGACRDISETINMKLTLGLFKRIDATWVEGSNNGGFPSTISIAPNIWYWVYVIGKPDGTTDGGFDSANNASNLLNISGPAYAAGYRYYRRVGAVRTDAGSDILAFGATISNSKRFFYWGTPINDFVDQPVPATATHVIRVPPSDPSMSITAQISATMSNDQANYLSAYIRRGGSSVITSFNNGISSISTGPYKGVGVGENGSSTVMQVEVDVSSQISYAAEGAITIAGTHLRVSTIGWYMGD